MHGDILSPDAAYYRTQYYRQVAHRRQVAQAQAGSDHQTTTGLRHRLGYILAAVVTRRRATSAGAPASPHGVQLGTIGPGES